ncbi:MAG: erythromycin esterase family protein [Gemmatimonadales bacterium]
MAVIRHGSRLALTTLLAALAGSTAAAQQASGRSLFINWARTHATRLAGPDASGCADLEPLRSAVANARVIALGELIHDARELHLFRNRLVRCLTAHFGVSAVALESGFADMAPLHEALLQPASSVAELTRERISYGWGGVPEVQALTESMRGYNAGQPYQRRTRLYGIDLTGADGSGDFNRARRSIDELLRFLARLDPTGARSLQNAFAPFLTRFSETGFPRLSLVARDSVRAFLDSAEAVIRRAPHQNTGDSSPARAWALGCLVEARHMMAYLGFQAALGEHPRERPDFWRLVQMRDSLMAENVLWVLGQLPKDRRLLILAHNAHVFADTGSVTMGPPRPRAPTLLGKRLRVALGGRYLVIGTDARALGYYVEEQGPVNRESLGSTLGELGHRWLLLDLGAAAKEPAVEAWLREPRLVRFQWGYQRIRPAIAADVLIYVDSLSPTGGEIP